MISLQEAERDLERKRDVYFKTAESTIDAAIREWNGDGNVLVNLSHAVPTVVLERLKEAYTARGNWHASYFKAAGTPVFVLMRP